MKFPFPKRVPTAIFLTVIAGYAFLIVVSPHLHLIDDHMILNSLMRGTFYTGYLPPHLVSVGRFYPLVMQEFNGLILFFKPSVQLFYGFVAIEFLALMLVLNRLLSYATENKNIKRLALLLLVFSPGFVTAFLRLHIGERSSLLLFSLFLLMYFLFQRAQNGIFFLASGIICANLALYFKEPGFLILGTFGFSHLSLGWKTLEVRQKVFDGLIVASSFAFLAVYYVVVFRHQGGTLYGDTPYALLFTASKNLFEYMITDPFLVLVGSGLLGFRVYLILSKREKPEPVFDSLLAAGFVYLLAFVKLNIFAYHYLLPAYAFSTVAILYFLIAKNYLRNSVMKMLTAAAFVLYLINALPLGLHLIAHYKNAPRNFQETVVHLTQYLRDQPAGKRTTIFLDGVNRGSGIEIYQSFSKYLAFHGVNERSYDLASDTPSNNTILFSKGDPSSPFTVFRNPGVQGMNVGDLLVVTPYSNHFVNGTYLQSLKDRYVLLFHAGTPVDIPNLSLKATLKYVVSHVRGKNGQPVTGGNVFEWSDYYVFQKFR